MVPRHPPKVIPGHRARGKPEVQPHVQKKKQQNKQTNKKPFILRKKERSSSASYNHKPLKA